MIYFNKIQDKYLAKIDTGELIFRLIFHKGFLIVVQRSGIKFSRKDELVKEYLINYFVIEKTETGIVYHNFDESIEITYL